MAIPFQTVQDISFVLQPQTCAHKTIAYTSFSTSEAILTVNAVLEVERYGNSSGTNYKLDPITHSDVFHIHSSALSLHQQCYSKMVYILCVHLVYVSSYGCEPLQCPSKALTLLSLLSFTQIKYHILTVQTASCIYYSTRATYGTAFRKWITTGSNRNKALELLCYGYIS